MPRRGCPRCETPSAPERGNGRLVFRFPTSHTTAKAARLLEAKAAAVIRRSEEVIEVVVHAREQLPVLVELESNLSSHERRSTRTLFVLDGKAMSPDDYFEIDSLDRYRSRLEAIWLNEMIANDAFTTYFQPIVRLDGGAVRPFGYECLLRGVRDGEIVMPTAMLDVAYRADMLSPFDHAARRSAVRSLTVHKSVDVAFVNVSPQAIYDVETCLEPTVDQLASAGISFDRIVFEIIESDRAEPSVLATIMDFYRSKGFRVALDDLGAGFSSFALLNSLRPEFVKIDMQFIRGVDKDPYKATIARKILEIAHGLGIESVAEGIETEGEFAWACANGATYGQGFLFGRPAASPQRVFDPVNVRAAPESVAG